MTVPRQAPEFPRGYPWINSDPISLHDDLAGHVVLLHFWTASSIYCLHVLPALQFLEQQFDGERLAILGVHSGKFAAEHEPDHVSLSVQEHGVRHPVLVDRDLSVWRAFGARSWPTLILIDASGQIRFQGAGEPDRDRLAAAIAALLAETSNQYEIPGSPPAPRDPAPRRSLEGLHFPSKLAVDADRSLLWIADTGNHRVVAVRPDTGQTHLVVGSGIPGAADGPFDRCCFYRPRGIAIDLREVYIADSGNHLLRRIDLEASSVDTVLGQGKQVIDLAAGHTGSDQGLNSPWALAMAGDDVLIALAGTHQLWKVHKDTMTAQVLAGRGYRDLQDARLLGAALAQPSGMSCSKDQDLIAFADSEASAVRIAKVKADWVTTLVGEGLFEWGDRDGPLLTARLQHPEDVAFQGSDTLFVADTFNHKVKRIDLGPDEPPRRTITTILGPDAGLEGPEGLAVHEDANLLFVADTRNHRILKVDLGDNSWSELEITGLPPARTAFGTVYSRAQPVQLASMADVTLTIPLDIPDGARLHPDVPATLHLENIEGHPLLVDMTLTPRVEGDVAIAESVSTAEESAGVIALRLTYLTCHEMDHVCHVHEVRRELPVELVEGGQRDGRIGPQTLP
jgi:thiol-disulfide isomerase/thioredoxin